MKAFLDTSILVPSFYSDDPRHETSFKVLLHFRREEAGCAGHSLLETYAVLTRMPGKFRTDPNAALLFLAEIRERLTIVTMGEPDYVGLLEMAAANGLTGGSIYDAAIAYCASKANAKDLYTWDFDDFRRIAPKSVQVRRPTELEAADRA